MTCPILVIRALQGIGGNPLAQMVDATTLEAARREVPTLRSLDIADATHGQLVRAPYAAQVASEILAVAP